MADLLNTEYGHEIGTGPEYIPQPKLILEPLVIPEIVREIIKFIQPKDLPKYRLVCRTWNEEIIPQIMNRSTFCFDSSQQIDNFIENGQPFFGFKNLNLKCAPLNNSECPCPTTRLLSSNGKLLRRLHLDHGSVDSRPRITMLIRSIKYIYLTLANSLELEFLKLTQLMFIMPKKNKVEFYASIVAPPITLNKLTTLDIDLYPAPNPKHDPTEQTQEFYTQLLRIAPNLKEFHLKSENCEARRGTSIHNCIRALMAVNPPHLKGLYFHSRIPLEWAKQLSTRLTSNIQKLVFDNLHSTFALNFDSTSSSGNRIRRITKKGKLYFGIRIPASDIINYYQNKMAECEPGVSCTQLLQTFLTAFEDRLQAGVAHVHK